MNVGLLRVELELSHAGNRLGSEGLVQLEEGDVRQGHARPGQDLPYRGNRAQPHVGGVHPARRVSHDPGERLHAEGGGLGPAHDHEGGRGIVDARRVSGRDGAVLLDECRGKLAHLLEARVHGPLVRIEREGGFVSLRHLDGDDLFGKDPVLDRLAGTLVTQEAEFVLLFPRDTVGLCDVLCSDAHVIPVEDLPKAVVYHQIHHGLVEHARAPAPIG